MTTVSVVIPTYNRADVLPRAIDSVLNQTYEDFNVVVIDDGSTDNTEDVVKSYVDDRIQYIQFKNNKGANAARTKGIKSATGEYIAFIDSDDEWLSLKIEKQIEAIQSTNADAAYTGIRQVDQNGNYITSTFPTISGNITDELLRGNFIGSYSTVIVSQELIDKVGYPDPELPCWQDWEWYLRLSDNALFAAVNEPLVIRHNDGDQISDNFQYRLESLEHIREKLYERASGEAQTRIAEAYLNFHVGYSALINHRYSAARSRFVRSIRLHPQESKFYIYLSVSSRIYPLIREFKRTLARVSNIIS